jgi:hypothetical protein
MSFQPVVPLSGYAGWRFLQRTLDTQKTAYVESVPVKRTTTYFRDNIAKIRTAEDLVGDRRLLEVALGAFGLGDDINNRFFIRKVLEDGTADNSALANKLADKRYAAIAAAFGFGNGAQPRTRLAGFPDEIIARYNNRSFEAAVGAQDGNMRLALNLGPALDEVTSQTQSANAQWFGIMGSAPLRSVLEGALGFPSSFGQIDLDQQLVAFQDRSKAVLGTDKVADFSDPVIQEKIVRLFLIRAEAASGGDYSSNSIALTLLQSASAPR